MLLAPEFLSRAVVRAEPSCQENTERRRKRMWLKTGDLGLSVQWNGSADTSADGGYA